MIYVFNKNKIFSYVVASFIVVGMFVFSSSIIPSKDIELIKVWSNIITNNVVNAIDNIKENNY